MNMFLHLSLSQLKMKFVNDEQGWIQEFYVGGGADLKKLEKMTCAGVGRAEN